MSPFCDFQCDPDCADTNEVRGSKTNNKIIPYVHFDILINEQQFSSEVHFNVNWLSVDHLWPDNYI